MAASLQEGGAVMPRRTLGFAAALLLLNLGGAYLLDALGLVEGLLSPNGGRLALLLPLAVLFYAARLLLLFVAPGLVLGALLLWAAGHRAGASSKPRS
jgi:hypothetical protein